MINQKVVIDSAMMSHINPIPTSFKDLVSSDKKGSEDVSSIPRIDD